MVRTVVGKQARRRAAGLWVGLLLAAPATAGEEILAPTRAQNRTTHDVVAALSWAHYQPINLDDGLSTRILQQYLDFLDPSRLFFLQSDVDDFQKYSTRLDDALRKGDLEPAFTIFNVFQRHRIARLERLQTMVTELLPELAFDVEEELELDRSEAPWPRSEDEADELWRKRFKNEVLNLRLADRTTEEIADVLEKRYTDQLRRVRQINSGDVFGMFINVFAHAHGPHTEYFPPRDAENFDIHMKLSLEGIGALLNVDGEFVQIVELVPAGPAEKSGLLQPSDRIVAVGQGPEGEMVDVVGWRTDEVVDLIRGPKGTVVKLSVLPSNQTDVGAAKVVSITRDQVKLEEQAAQKSVVEVHREGRDYRVGVIALPAFYMDFAGAHRGDPDYRSSTRDVERLIGELKEQGVDGLVMDLRRNGGGSLVEANELTGLFLGAGPVVQVRDSEGKVQVLGSEREDPAWEGPLAVLVDRLSASASEIFAAAVQDTGRGVVIGGRTFGKGTVQTLMPLDDGQLKLTQAKFYRLSGGSTQHRGVLPDVFYPEMYDNDEVGESALDDALPWDEIQPVPHERGDRFEELAPTLERLHQDRIVGDPEFVYVTELLDYSRRGAATTRLSLHEETRRRERARLDEDLLAIENRRRVALGQEPVGSMEEIERDSSDELDAWGKEAAQILVDVIAQPPGRRVVQSGADR